MSKNSIRRIYKGIVDPSVRAAIVHIKQENFLSRSDYTLRINVILYINITLSMFIPNFICKII